jgi:hypothetical protein
MSDAHKWALYLQQIRANTQNDHEAFFNLAYLLAEKLDFPLQANWLREDVVVTAVNLTYSSHSHGLRVDIVNRDELLPLEELSFIDADPTSAKWIAFYHYWRKETH